MAAHKSVLKTSWTFCLIFLEIQKILVITRLDPRTLWAICMYKETKKCFNCARQSDWDKTESKNKWMSKVWSAQQKSNKWAPSSAQSSRKWFLRSGLSRGDKRRLRWNLMSNNSTKKQVWRRTWTFWTRLKSTTISICSEASPVSLETHLMSITGRA